MFFFWKKMLNCDFSKFWNYYFFDFSDVSVGFSANSQSLGMELVSNVYLWPILPSPGNNSISTKWALYLWNATYSPGSILFYCNYSIERARYHWNSQFSFSNFFSVLSFLAFRVFHKPVNCLKFFFPFFLFKTSPHTVFYFESIPP